MNFTELSKTTLTGNETYFIKAGIYKDVSITLKSNGTVETPVYIEGSNNVYLEGKTKIVLDGENLTFTGFKFNGCNGNKIIQIKGNNIKFTGNTIDGIGNDMENYLCITGMNCRINNNSFSNFNKSGCIINFKHNKTKGLFGLVDNNRFNNRKEIENKKYPFEMIVIGNKKLPSYPANVSVYNNFFNECLGDNVITVNSSDNLIICNKIFRCYGSITLKAGNNNKVVNNYINGEDLEKAGGIKILGEGHLIIGNTIERIVNDKPDLSPISIFCGVKNVKILHNDFLTCFAGFSIGVKSDLNNTVKPENLEIKYNRVVKSSYFNLNNNENLGYENSQVIENEFLEKDIRLRIKQGKNVKVSPKTFFENKFDYNYLLYDYDPEEKTEEKQPEQPEHNNQDFIITDDDDLKSDEIIEKKENVRGRLMEDIYNSLYVLREFRIQLIEYKKLQDKHTEMINNVINLLD